MVQQVVFAIILLATIYLAFRFYGRIIKAIRLGKNDFYNIDNKPQRWKNTFLIALGQKKMFKNWIPAILHLFIYVAFLFTQVELIEIIIDGLSGSHRFFAPFLGGFYSVIISTVEILSLLALIGTVIFLIRRNIIKVKRFEHPEMKGWPKLDANLILLGEILLVTGIFTMNGADTVLQSLGAEHFTKTSSFAISSWLGPMLFGNMDVSSLLLVERFGWWLHLLVVIGFILYLPFSKHLHIFFAFPNVFYSSLEPAGKMSNMPNIMQEVQLMMNPSAIAPPPSEEPMKFGAKDVSDLNQSLILSAFACTECGRCTDNCPANETGKLLSPRKIMMDVRDRATEIIEDQEKAMADNQSLFDKISQEELSACTTCNACVEQCPINIRPLEIIQELRRYLVLEEAKSSEEWNMMFANLENNGAPWQFPAVDRGNWRNE